MRRWASGLRPAFLLALVLGVPSVGLVQKYLGYGGAGVYLVGVGVAASIVRAEAFARLWRSLDERAALVLAGAILSLVTAVVFIVHPNIDATKGDANDALNIAARELFHGRYPYYPHTQLGNPIVPLPGSIFMAMPFVAFSDSTYQNLFWLLLFTIFCRAVLGSWRASLLVLGAILLLSPTVVQELILGEDRIANTIFVLIFSSLLIFSLTREKPNDLLAMFTAVLFGVALSSRSNFLFLVPLVFAAISQRRGIRCAVVYTGVSVAAFLAITLPFYLHDPHAFGPRHSITKLHEAFPLARTLALTSTAALALYLASRRNDDLFLLLRNSAVVQGLLFIWAVGLFALDTKDASYTFVFMKEGYGVQFLFFGALAWWIRYGDFWDFWPATSEPRTLPKSAGHG
jgi:hypothetical protein